MSTLVFPGAGEGRRDAALARPRMTPDPPAVIRVLNEAEALRTHLGSWLAWCRAHASRLIVVDDGSSDGTSEILTAHLSDDHLRVFRQRHNRGSGHAIKTGILHAESPFVGTMDAAGAR